MRRRLRLSGWSVRGRACVCRRWDDRDPLLQSPEPPCSVCVSILLCVRKRWDAPVSLSRATLSRSQSSSPSLISSLVTSCRASTNRLRRRAERSHQSLPNIPKTRRGALPAIYAAHSATPIVENVFFSSPPQTVICWPVCMEEEKRRPPLRKRRRGEEGGGGRAARRERGSASQAAEQIVFQA